MMRDEHRFALIVLAGAIAAYFAGLGVMRLGGDSWLAMSVAFAVTVAALYAGWVAVGRSR